MLNDDEGHERDRARDRDGLPAEDRGSFQVHLANREARAREQAAAEGRRQRELEQREATAKAVDAVRRRPVAPPPTTAGPAIPTRIAAVEHAQPEVPRGVHATCTPPAELEARAGDPRLAHELRLRHCADLPAAIREVRDHLFRTGDQDERALGARLDRAQQIYAIHYEQYLMALRAIVRGHAIEALRLAGLDEFAAAIETGDFGRILGGPS